MVLRFVYIAVGILYLKCPKVNLYPRPCMDLNFILLRLKFR